MGRGAAAQRPQVAGGPAEHDAHQVRQREGERASAYWRLPLPARLCCSERARVPIPGLCWSGQDERGRCCRFRHGRVAGRNTSKCAQGTRNSAARPTWRHPTITAALPPALRVFSKLNVAFFARKYPAVQEAFLKSLLETSVKYFKTLAGEQVRFRSAMSMF